MRTIVRCFLLFGLVAFVPRVAAAQATLAGEVKDTTGAVLPGVTVIVSARPPTVSTTSTVTTPEPLTLISCRVNGANPVNENVTV